MVVFTPASYYIEFMDRKKITGVLTARISYHIYFWVGVFILKFVNHISMDMPSLEVMWRTLIVIGLTIPVIYTHFHVFEKYLIRKRYGGYVFFLLLIILTFVFFKNLIFIPINQCQINIWGNVSFIVTYLFITTALKVGKAGFEQRLAFQKIKAQHVQTELELLKSQIHPHFLFNTLNNLFGLVRKLDERVADGIAQLSHLLRYMIHESNVDRIELEKEILQVRRLIDLQKLRFSEEDDISIDFTIDGGIEGVRIPPMLLIPFVENAFKHGISLEESSFIEIYLRGGEEDLEFRVKNSIHHPIEKEEETPPGTGLKNVKRRLDLLYPKSHALWITQTENEFLVKLMINQ